MFCRATPDGRAERDALDARRRDEAQRARRPRRRAASRARARGRGRSPGRHRLDRQEAAAALGGRDQRRLGIRAGQHDDDALERPLGGGASSDDAERERQREPGDAPARARARGSPTTAPLGRRARRRSRQAPGARECRSQTRGGGVDRRRSLGERGEAPLPLRGARPRSTGSPLRQPGEPSPRARRRACRARTPRRGRRGGRSGRGGRGSWRAIRARSPRRRGTSSAARGRAAPRTSRCRAAGADARASSACESPWKNASAIACFWPPSSASTQSRTECASAPASSSSIGRRSHAPRNSISGLVVVAGHRHRVELAPAQLVEAAVAHDAREPRLRLALRCAVAAGVMPDVDERLLQELLGERPVPARYAARRRTDAATVSR